MHGRRRPVLISFGLDRVRFVTRDLRDYFGLERYKISLDASDPSGGTIRLNDMDIDINGSIWNGVIMEDIPVTLEAAPGDGYRFAGWETNVGFLEEPVVTLVPKTNLEIRAVFVRD